MNLHILPDSKFSERFYVNLEELGLTGRNKFVVRSNQTKLSYVGHSVPVAKLYSKAFDDLIGDTLQYEKVFIHQFSPLMYRWVALNRFRELNWCVWGADVYNLPGVGKDFYEPMTWSGYSKAGWKKEILYTLKLYATNMYFRKDAYRKVNNVLTWMGSEYDYIKSGLQLPQASWRFFFYENAMAYEQLDAIRERNGVGQKNENLKLIVGNSGTDTNNHLDAIKSISDSGVNADLIIPVSYGSPDYKAFLKRNVSFYKGGSIQFMDEFMAFDDYVKLLLCSDGLVMNHLRPQGYGNILMMMYLEKPVFLNPRNLSIRDLNANNLRWHSLSDIGRIDDKVEKGNREAVQAMFSHERLLNTYREIF